VVRSGLFSRDNEHEPLQYGKEITTALCISSNLKETEVKTIDENKCQQCGAHALPDAKYCEQCGAQLHVEVESQPQSVPSYVPAPTFQAPSYVTETPYEGVPIRFVATLIDAIIISVIAGLLGILIKSQFLDGYRC
jgi:hypothetical protein